MDDDKARSRDDRTGPAAQATAAAADAAAAPNITLNVSLQTAISTALYVNNVPVLTELALINDGGETLGDVTLELTCDCPALRPKTWRLAQVGPGQVRTVSDLDITLDGPWLAAVTEGLRGRVTVTARAGDRLLADAQQDIRLLAHNEWGGISTIPDLLAAFVEPNDPTVPTVLRRASSLLRAAGKPDGLEGYQATTKARLWEQAAAIWSAVCALDIRYANPPPSFEETGQRVRPPRQIAVDRIGTCLDLAVLFAACLEHAGLRPLIVLTKGHAFPGIWLSRHDFGASVADDAASLRTRLALDDVLLFESTLCCQSPAPGFKAACAAGAEHVTARHDAEFIGVIDIRRARQRHIRPLGALADAYARAPQAEDPSAPQPGPPPIDDAPTLRDDSDLGDSEAPPTTPEGRLDRWRKRLLDLSSRNRLVNLNIEGKQALPIDCPDPAGLEQLLAEMRGSPSARPLKLRPWPDLMSGADPRSAQLHRNRMHEDAPAQFAREAFARRELLVARAEDALKTNLTELYRSARAALQEGGANTLFLTIGALLWKPVGKDRAYRAPLLLVPVVLARESVRSDFQLRAHDDETRLNTTLLELLRQDFDVRIPELDSVAIEDGSGIDVKTILDIFRLKARQIPGWEVTDDIALTTLSFTKYLMWKDLADRKDALAQSVVARRLMNGPEANSAGEPGRAPAADSLGRSALQGGRQDDDPDLSALACPLEADSSQLRAVAAAARGENFVLIGPPGTGKSQTITNIIANTLAQGRTVLFVAEKRAALEVVHRKLSSKEVGLGDFCLDLFSAKASKMAVLEQLNRAQQVREDFDSTEWPAAIAKVAALRAELNGYVRELHKTGRNGWTAYRAIGTVLHAEASGVPTIGLRWPGADVHDAGTYQSLTEAVAEAAATFHRLGEVAAYAPLSGIDRNDWSPSWQAALIDVARAAASALTVLQDATGRAQAALSLPASTPMTRAALDAMDALAALLLDPAAPEAGWAFGDDADDVCEALYAAGALAEEHAALAATLQGKWRPAASELPLAQLLADWQDAAGRWLIPRRAGQKAVMARLGPAAIQIPDDPVADLQTLIAMQERAAEFATIAAQITPVLGRRWRGMQTEFARAGQGIVLASRIRAAAAACAPDPVALLAMRDHIRRLLTDGADLLADAAAIGRPLRQFRAAHEAAKSALLAVTPLCGGDAGATVADAHHGWPGAVAAQLRDWASSAHQLRNWCAWRGIMRKAEALGVAPILTALEAGTIGHEQAESVFEANYARWWINLAVDDLPLLRAFVAAQHEQRISRFRALDVRLRDLASKLVRARLSMAVPGSATRQKSPEYGVLTRELAKRQRHLPVRQLFERMPDAIRKLGPCAMMSPLSVAQYLPADATPFDLVIFDEASQIATWDAIGAIGRGSQVIVVGDPKQLPPTQFFQRQIIEGDAGGDNSVIDTEDLESVLDECLGAGLPRIELTWHYRSRHESLIAFSNRQYYGGSLVTFPSPYVRDAAVSFRHVPEGVYARGGARTNLIEAQAVVTEAVKRLRSSIRNGHFKSIGIVTFNAEQQTLIENLLERERSIDPALERFFGEDEAEPVLIKNLEGVQGEERDIVLFSLTYGPDAAGRVAMNFGPLNQTGGERRLNVAVTRAREALIVFGSLRPDQIDLNRTAAAGVAHLKLFLGFAEHGARAFATAASASLGDFESHFEAVVAERLRALGWTVHPQIGVSDFRIDLGVVDPSAPGSYLAGVECDGATYHRSASARDRDRLRQAVLEGLDWRILRIWSTDWWTNAGQEAERVHLALQGLLADAAARRAVPVMTEPEPLPLFASSNASALLGDTEMHPSINDQPASGGVSSARPERSEAASTATPHNALPEMPTLEPARFHDEDYRPVMAALVARILQADAPMRDDQLCQKVARAHGFQRTGRLIKEAVLAVVPRHCVTTDEADAMFVWPQGTDPKSWQTFRTPAPGCQIDPADIPLEELTVLAQRALKQAAGDEEGALQVMRDACGLGRLREVTKARFIRAIEKVQLAQQ